MNFTINDEQLQKTSNFLYKLLLSIGIVVMFIVGTILGIKFMAASAEDKAKVKEALIPYVVGCVVIFGAFTIWETVVNVGTDVFEWGEVAYNITINDILNGYIEFDTKCKNENHDMHMDSAKQFRVGVHSSDEIIRYKDSLLKNAYLCRPRHICLLCSYRWTSFE